MANNTKGSGRRTSGSAQKTANSVPAQAPAKETAFSTAVTESVQEQAVEAAPVKIVPKEIDPHQYIPVKSGVHGKLIYKSRKTGEKFVWQGFGEEQDMELQELRNAKSANKKFFERNWFMFDDEYDWVIDYLGVRAFYRNALSIDHFDDIFEMRPAEIGKRIAMLSEGQKKAVRYRATQLISEDGIDSIKVIEALEKALGIELIER